MTHASQSQRRSRAAMGCACHQALVGACRVGRDDKPQGLSSIPASVPAQAGIQEARKRFTSLWAQPTSLVPSPSRGGLGWGWVKRNEQQCAAQAQAHPHPHPNPPLEGEGAKQFQPTTALALFLSSTSALAQTTPAAPAGPSLGPLLMMFFLVLVLIPVALWLLKRIQPGTHSASAGLKVVGQLVLGPRERIVVVEAGERWLLLGVTASSIQRVGTLPKGAVGDGETPVVQTPAFLSVLQKFKS